MHRINKEEIEESSIPFPIFIVDKDNKDVKVAIYIDFISKEGTFGLPDIISVVRETDNGTETLGLYELTQSEKFSGELDDTKFLN